MDRRIITLISASVLLLAIVVVVVVAGGGSDDESGGKVSDNLEERPVIEASDDPPPTELESNDIVVGDGAEAKTGDSVSVQYAGALYDTGQEFDASWDRGEPFDFDLGTSSVIKGWDEGIQGMKVGGRRELIIPPDLAYGEPGQPPTIPPNATLVFVVDLLEVK